MLNKKIFSQIRDTFGSVTYNQGLTLYMEGKVSQLRAVNYSRTSLRISAEVDYESCSAYSSDDNINFDYSHCSCREMVHAGICKHLCALIIAYTFDRAKSNKQINRDELMNMAIDENMNYLIPAFETNGQTSNDGKKFFLTPVLDFQNNQLSASFRIGSGSKSYMIMGLRDFAERIKNRQVHHYGTDVDFVHDINKFDERSQILCRMILNFVDSFELILRGKKWMVQQDFGDVRSISISGDSFDRIFDMYAGEKLPCKGSGNKLLREYDPEPEISASIEHGLVKLSSNPDIQVYNSGAYGYIITKKEICRVSEKYAKDVLPVIDRLKSCDDKILLNSKGAERFCMSVAPKLSEHVHEGALAKLEPYMPEALEVRYLLDMPERDRMTCVPNFNYNGRYVDCTAGENAYPDIRRNLILEQNAINALKQYFDPPMQGEQAYSLTDEDKMYELIKTNAQILSPYGEVFISDRLRKIISNKTSKPTMRAGVSNGMLELKLDTDEFPQEELESLMRSVREKRKYYRLGDGSFVNLEEGQFSAFTRTADSLNLHVNDLIGKGALVPLYKGLFLDEVLSRDKSVSLEKDTDYKKLIRDFKTVEDGEFTIPEPLDRVLRDYQKIGYAWLRTLDKYGFGGILADDMGLGKTLQLLAFLLGLKREGKGGTALIACPASVVATWGSEAARWVPELRVCLLTGNAQDRQMRIHEAHTYDIVVSSYDSMRNDIDHHAKQKYRVCVLDEAQYIKNRETKLKRSVEKLNARTRLALTGTPVENRLSELYSIFDFLMPSYLGSYTSFRQRFEVPIAERDDESAKNILTKLVSPFILRRMKNDVLNELPPKTETNCYIQMGEGQRKLYLAYANEVKKAMQSAQASDKLKILSMLTRLRQICCDPALVYENMENDSCKLDECVRMVGELIENEHRVLIFSQFTTMLARIEQRLEQEGIRSFTLKGDTPLDERVRLVNTFNAGKNDVFLISLKAGGTGINLTGADTVIHYDPWWNIAAQNQATDRCYRIGQERPVQVYKLIAQDTIEENIVKLQYKKLDLANVVSGNSDGGLMHMSSEELMELLG